MCYKYRGELSLKCIIKIVVSFGTLSFLDDESFTTIPDSR